MLAVLLVRVARVARVVLPSSIVLVGVAALGLSSPFCLLAHVERCKLSVEGPRVVLGELPYFSKRGLNLGGAALPDSLANFGAFASLRSVPVG